MNRKTILSLGSALVAVGVMSVAGYGCGDDDTATTTKDSGTVITPEAGTTDTGTTDSSTPIPAPPALGAQIDRMGRPAINTALNHTFDPDTAAAGAAKDAYNQDSTQAGWNQYVPQMAANLAVFDSLDTVCGNAFLAQDGGVNAGPSTAVYGALAGITADDRLWLNTAGTACGQYLAVEGTYAAGAGLLPAALAMPNECGGRTLAYDVIDLTYSAVSIGALAGVGDGVAADPIKTAATAFPYLAPPTQ